MLLDHTGRNHQACNVDWIWGREAKPGRKKFFVEFSRETGRVQKAGNGSGSYGRKLGMRQQNQSMGWDGDTRLRELRVQTLTEAKVEYLPYLPVVMSWAYNSQFEPHFSKTGTRHQVAADCKLHTGMARVRHDRPHCSRLPAHPSL